MGRAGTAVVCVWGCLLAGIGWGEDAPSATPEASIAAPLDFVKDIRPILQQHCYTCHADEKQKSGLRLDVREAAFQGGELYGPSLVPGKPEESPLLQFVIPGDADLRMPPEGEGLSAAEIQKLTAWIAAGANWPEGVDLARLEDRRDHWSFYPVKPITPPAVQQTDWPRDPLDQFILARLEAEELAPAPEADRVSWLRRVTIDLTGLPPTPEELTAFLNDETDAAYGQVVNRLLASPRYGERWGRHWLDVVRYADTHGFEVNTERPHAWPYRDYVIAALNRDLPYDQFVREQIAGDQLQADAATGFLVTASVLLPGQIGKDEPSIRLARQDALDEIVVNIGQTFLGLSIGCARCHDHKFDPISQREYFAMQAFVAGVEYLDREYFTPEYAARQQQIPALQAERAELERHLLKQVPLARAGQLTSASSVVDEGQASGETDTSSPAAAANSDAQAASESPATPSRPMVQAALNVDRWVPRLVSRLRFTVLATNSLEPCLDELEVWTPEGVNVALSAAGTTVTASGSRVSRNRHELHFVHDGQYGNSRSWMSDETGGGWVELQFPEPTVVEAATWGRDREGKFKDRLPINYRIEVLDTAGNWHLVADGSDRLPFDPQASGTINNAYGSPEGESELARLLVAKQKLDRQLTQASSPPLVFAGKFRNPDRIHLLRRGDPEQPQQPVAPAVMSVLGELELPEDAGEAARRTALADWIASPEHPLTARVMVNRIWQGHFGTGLVETPNDFGRLGIPPSHPELLDWLANEFIQSGWSLKHLHRRMVLSATYRQSTKLNPQAFVRDAENRWLWRFPLRRVEGEVIRDSMLAASGELNLKMGGSGFNLFDKRGGLSGFQPIEKPSQEGKRRMIYAHQVRRERDAVFGTFDCPDGGQSTPIRRVSTTPIQALNLLNSQFVLDRTQALADRVRQESAADFNTQVRRAYLLVLSREPDAEEVDEAVPVVEQFGLAPLCRALFNSSEFLYLP